MVLGTSTSIPESMLFASFELFLSCHERSVLRGSLNECDSQLATFTNDRVSQLISILSHHSCMQLPNPQNLQHLIMQVAQHEFITKPLQALHGLFWFAGMGSLLKVVCLV